MDRTLDQTVDPNGVNFANRVRIAQYWDTDAMPGSDGLAMATET
jgi:hypothetical protein